MRIEMTSGEIDMVFMTDDGTKVKRKVYSRTKTCKLCGAEMYKSKCKFDIKDKHHEIRETKKIWRWFE